MGAEVVWKVKVKKIVFIDGIEVTRLSDWDNQPIKNKLPAELKERMFTENQWLERKRKVKEGATGYDMHPNAMHKKLCTYYLREDTEPIPDDEECCATCTIRINRYCPIKEEHMSMTTKCENWCD